MVLSASSKAALLVDKALIVLPIPPSKPVNKAPSVPNLILFIIDLAGSLGSSLSIAVGPPNKSPKLPTFSTSPMKIPSEIPPETAPAINRDVLPLVFKSSAFFAVLANCLAASSEILKYFPSFLPWNALLARALPTLSPIVPGIPTLTRTSAIFPAAVASAFSSHSVRSSNHFSTSAALLVSAPRSMSSAPRETIPLGIAIKPDPIPARIDSITLILLSSSAGVMTPDFC